jgi:peptidoglycan/xylan/chitin deacetylase (PgdA/CDA1 family)
LKSDRVLCDTTILVYHRIVAEMPPKNASNLTVSVRLFERQMRYLSEHRYHGLSFNYLVQSSEDEPNHPRRRVLLTFDDGYESFLTQAYPILRRYGLAATVFLVTDYIGVRNGFLNWEQVKSLHRDGISFGSHTCTHPHLTQLSKTEVQHEFVSSKQVIEDRLGERIQLLAYPYTESNREIQQIASEAGYEAACGGDRGKTGRFNLLRTQCRSNDTHLGFMAKLMKWPRYANWLREETALGRFVCKVRPGN